MDKIVDCTITRINETIARWQRNDTFNESSKYTWIKKTDRVEIDALFGLMYFRGILGVNLHMTDRLFSNDSHFVFGAIMSKSVSNFLKVTFTSTTHKKEHSCGKQIDSQQLESSQKSSIKIFQCMFHHRNIFQLMSHYTQWDNKLPSASIIPISHIVMVCCWSHWMMQDFLIHTNLYLMLQYRRLEMVPITWSLPLTT